MSRLLESDIDTLEAQLESYEDIFMRQTGRTMRRSPK
jgi:pyrrolysine biosynthesis protein PylD